MVVPTLLTGLLAWYWEFEGRRLKGILLTHLLFGCASALMIATVWWIHRTSRRSGTTLPRARWGIEVFGLAIVALTGHLGGFLSGVNHP